VAAGHGSELNIIGASLARAAPFLWEFHAMPSLYQWVRSVADQTTHLYGVGIYDDGTLRNPNGYPEDVVRQSVLAADQHRRERRSNAAKKAAVTRRERQEKCVYEVAKRILAGSSIGARRHCYICGRHLDDPESINRGIGSECWQGVLAIIEAERRAVS
jgi:hypothetical protein